MSTDLFTIGASSLRVYQNALSTTSENIANAATPGYSRRTATIEEFSTGNVRQLAHSTKLNGFGSHITGIARAGDDLRAAEVRTTGSDLARTEGGIVWLERIENGLTGNQLAGRLTAFFNAAKSVAADPAASAPRAVMLESAQSLATAFAGTAQSLDAAMADLNQKGADAATQLSDLSAQLVRTNRGLTRVEAGSTAHAGLLDERDRILSSMSALTDVAVSVDGFGRATVHAGGAGGPLLADAENAALVTFASNPGGAVAFTAYVAGTPQAMVPSGGAMAGIADGAGKIANMRESIDDLATRLVQTVNTVQSQGRDLDNQAGAALFTIGASPTEIGVAISDPRKLAAAAVGEGVRGNGNYANLAALRVSGGFEAGLDDLTVANAAALAARRDVANAQTSIHGAAVSAHASVSGVDMDEEAVNLMRFQQAYQASSRVVQVARDILQNILDIR